MQFFLETYSIYNPKEHEYKPLMSKEDISWEQFSEIITKIYHGGGQMRIIFAEPQYTRGKYIEFPEVTGYYVLESLIFDCDPRYGYLLDHRIYKDGECTDYFWLENPNVEDPEEKYIFSPYDDEWEAKKVNQDVSIALRVFKELYDHLSLSDETKKLFKEG